MMTLLENEIQVLSSPPKPDNPRKRRPFLAGGLALAILAALIVLFCILQGEEKTEETGTHIDAALQSEVETMLSRKLSELSALSGQVIVMETQTGAVKAMSGLQRNFDATYVPCDIFAYRKVTGLLLPFSYMAALETGKVKLTDTVDVQTGIYLTDGITMKDHNWYRGGYGAINYEKGIISSSDIATYKAVQKAFAGRPQAYFDALDSLHWGDVDRISGMPALNRRVSLTPKDSLWAPYLYPFATIGYNQKIAAIQVLASYNAIANDGKMVKPQIRKGETEVVCASIASDETIKAIQQAMRHTVTDGLGRQAGSEEVEVAGIPSKCTVSGEEDDDSEGKQFTEFSVEFCGYFPFDNPRYSVIVSINKMGYPASGGMAGSLFKEIAEYIDGRERMDVDTP